MSYLRGHLEMPFGGLLSLPLTLDPPFNSNRNYNAIYKDETGRALPDQIEAFCDLWTLDAERQRAIQYMPVLMRDAGIDDAAAAAVETVASRLASHAAASAGLSGVYGGAPLANETHPEANWLDLSALRPDRQPLYQGAYGRHLRT